MRELVVIGEGSFRGKAAFTRGYWLDFSTDVNIVKEMVWRTGICFAGLDAGNLHYLIEMCVCIWYRRVVSHLSI